MKIFTSAQIHELDRYTIEHEPIKSVDLMERAAKAITRLSPRNGRRIHRSWFLPAPATTAVMPLPWLAC